MAKKKVAKKKVEPVDMVACEKEFRKYIRRDGGYCKGISESDRKRAKTLAKLLGKKELVWDLEIISVPQKSRLV